MKRNVAFLIFLLPAHLYSMDKPSGNMIIPDRVDQYKFSPDGRRLLTLKSVSPNHLAKNYLVNLYTTATGTLLKSFPERMSARFKWSPKGTYFAFKGLNLTEVLIMDQYGDLIRTVKTNGTIQKFNFSDSEKCIYYNLIERTSSSRTALNYQVMETTIASGLTSTALTHGVTHDRCNRHPGRRPRRANSAVLRRQELLTQFRLWQERPAAAGERGAQSRER